jgi:hypothetical protein
MDQFSKTQINVRSASDPATIGFDAPHSPTQRNTSLHAYTIAVAAGLGLSLAGCNAGISPTQIANVACIGAQAGAAVGVTMTADATGSNATNAQGTATAVQNTVADACPIIVTGVGAISSASKTSSSAGK